MKRLLLILSLLIPLVSKAADAELREAVARGMALEAAYAKATSKDERRARAWVLRAIQRGWNQNIDRAGSEYYSIADSKPFIAAHEYGAEAGRRYPNNELMQLWFVNHTTGYAKLIFGELQDIAKQYADNPLRAMLEAKAYLVEEINMLNEATRKAKAAKQSPAASPLALPASR